MFWQLSVSPRSGFPTYKKFTLLQHGCGLWTGTNVAGGPIGIFLLNPGRDGSQPRPINTQSPLTGQALGITTRRPQHITRGPHEAGVWAKHPSLMIPAPSRGEPSRHLGSSYQRGMFILSPLIADLSGLWGSSMQVMHGRPQGLFSRWQGSLWNFENH